MPLFRAKIFGSQLFTNSSVGISTTTSTTTWQNKCTITTTTIPPGTYMLRWTIKGKFSSSDKEYEFRVIDGSSTQLAYAQFRTPLAAVEIPWTSSQLFVLTEASYTYTLQFRCVDAGTVTVSEANLEFWRLE
jgi:hypothetical protein